MLVEALPYIQRFRGRVVVVKYGGNAMVDPALATSFAEDIVLMHSVGLRPVVVHGGGPQISDLMERLGKVPEFRDGQRVTDAETIDIARMVLVGKVNRDIVGSINVHGPLAVGVSGEDAGLIRAEARHPDLGFVGDVEAVNPSILERLLAEELIPVVSTIGADASGQAYNINADAVAGALAEALAAEKVIYLTDVEGLLADLDDPSSLISHIDAKTLQALLDDGTLSGGMIPKITACLHAVAGGVGVRPPPRRPLAARRAPRAVQRRRRRHDDHGGAEHDAPHAEAMGAPALEHCPLMPTYGPPTLQLVRGEGSWLWDKDGRQYLDLLSGLAVTGLGHSHPAVADALHEQAQTLLHVSNLFGTDVGWQVACTLDRLLGGPNRPARLAGRGHARAGVLRQLRCRGQRVRPQAGPEVRRPRTPRRRERVRVVPRTHAGHAPRHRPAGQARGVPAAPRGVPARRLERSRRPRGGPRPVGGRGPARAGAGRGGREPRDGRVLPGRPPALRRARRSSSWSTRCRPVWGAAVRGSAISGWVSCPTWSPWPRRSATACPSVPAGPRPRSRPPSNPATTPRPSAANRWPPRRPARCWR